MDIILIAGLWLPKSTWAGVAAELDRLGHRAIPLALPGVDDGSTSATLADQVASAVAAVDGADRPFVVGHSAACSLAWIVADQRPDTIHGVAMIGGFPTPSGDAYAAFFDIIDGVMPFPGWAPFDGPDSADLDEEQRQRISESAVPVAQGVAEGIVELTDDGRFKLPVLLICPEYSPEQAREWIDAGDVPELEKCEHLSFVDIDSGHWPMLSRPAELAQIIHRAASID